MSCSERVHLVSNALQSTYVTSDNVFPASMDGASRNRDTDISLHLRDDRSIMAEQRLAPDGERPSSETSEDEERTSNGWLPWRVAVHYADAAKTIAEDQIRIIERLITTQIPSSGNPVKSKRLSRDKRTLFMTFEKPVCRSLFEKDLRYRDCQLCLTALDPEIEEDLGHSLALGISHEHSMKKCLPQITNYMLQYHFKKLAYNYDEDSWIFTLETLSDADAVLNNGLEVTHEGVTFTLFAVTNDAIEPWIEGQTEADRFLVGRLPPNAECDQLKDFVERNTTNKITNVDIRCRKALITLSHPLDFRGLAKLFHQMPLNGHMLSVQKVPLTLTMLVTSSENEMVEEDLQINFSHYAQKFKPALTMDDFKEKITVDQAAKMKATVQFPDRQVLDYVLGHCSDMGTLTLFHECIEEPMTTAAAAAAMSSDFLTSVQKSHTD